ncbi:acyloxyacyl hydrolase [Galbibacter pacificus]|uniref:Acyloxyacyl hydrolase n=1 Tax=Galbibacter pacificus TaxID=2996052 RepID=A0ABT6FMS2_9FLAO|nr:acyloxyacyl hydrolase [Galbibacter pacificus]MDG3581004.1 acyloxyacyl hydrolase [Galbibacter pacificus]MDG3584482.1 acyloxyacyl hydrolase [Galbibacter pacificus]
MQRVLAILFLVFSSVSFAQENTNSYASYFDVNYFYGNITRHNNDILHLITAHPEGVVFSWNKKTYGDKEWEQLYNYPDYGASLIYHNFKNEYMGSNVAFYGHYNFYFFNRNLMFRVGQGIAIAGNPYDKEDNYRNVAFGSKLLSSTYLMLNYKKERIFDKFGLQAGLTLVHYSNGNTKAPNTSINTVNLNVGVNYQLDAIKPEYIKTEGLTNRFTEPVRFNFVFRTGVNESDVIHSGQFPFYVFSVYADKRLNKKSAIQLGTDVFYSNFLKEYIEYSSIAYPERGIDGSEDYKRAGIFIGHELFINRFSVIAQAGYYVYYPIDYEGQMYLRGGLKGYITKNKKLFGVVTVKAHAAQAEAVEIGIGYRL